eukprot:CAMPEP_0117668780 /NCGR_PEP_ID=MMETSP0804-20121206/11749_1 /TAXON_ID=1074897 /ORGANISM="Tetraselmis astigmatica, Strain CCMP880" /LENGTH=236 /DNA_ID=CAMNT_0005476729 /DNA_START=219 /DNA_END=926 /DNA_ORIENTATION=-
MAERPPSIGAVVSLPGVPDGQGCSSSCLLSDPEDSSQTIQSFRGTHHTRGKDSEGGIGGPRAEPHRQGECRICLESVEDEGIESGGDVVSPCICTGTLKWAHLSCLEMWVAERPGMALRCEICGAEYKEEIAESLRKSAVVSAARRAPAPQAGDGQAVFVFHIVGPYGEEQHHSIHMSSEEGSDDISGLIRWTEGVALHRRARLQFWLRTLILLLLTALLLYMLRYVGSQEQPSFW